MGDAKNDGDSKNKFMTVQRLNETPEQVAKAVESFKPFYQRFPQKMVGGAALYDGSNRVDLMLQHNSLKNRNPWDTGLDMSMHHPFYEPNGEDIPVHSIPWVIGGRSNAQPIETDECSFSFSSFSNLIFVF